MPLYPQNQTVPPGQTAPFQPQWQSFLPTDPNAMATGLTPQMMQGINKPPSMVPPPGQQPASGPATNYQQLLDFFKQLGGGNFGGAGGMGGGAQSPGQVFQNARAGVGDYSRDDIRNATRAAFLGIPMPVKIPQPTPGANGMISPGDQAAWSAAQQQANKQRDQLAKQMIDARKMRRNPGGSR